MNIAEDLRSLVLTLNTRYQREDPFYRKGLTIVDQMVNIIKVVDPYADVSGIATIKDAVYPMATTVLNGKAPKRNEPEHVIGGK